MNFTEFMNKLEKFELKQKLKNKIAFLFPAFFFMFSTANGGILVSQFVRDAHNGYPAENAQVTLIRHPTGGTIDTVFTNVWFGMWATDGANFEPDLKPGDKLEVIINKDGYAAHCIDSIKNYSSHLLPDIHIDDPNKPPHSRTPIIYIIKDTSGVNVPFYGIFELKKNLTQPCTALVDTSSGPDRVYDWFLNTEYQDSTANHGDSAYVTLKKEFGNIIYIKKIGFTIDTMTHFDVTHIKSNGNSGNDTIIFPETTLIGMVEENLENRVKDGRLIVRPNITKGNIVLNQEGDFYLYNVLGALAYQGKYQKGNQINLNGLPAGIYMLFLKPKDDELLKPEKLVILKRGLLE